MNMLAANLLRKARESADLTLRELARRAGTSHSTLAAYEAGHKTPSVDTMERIVRAAGFALDLEFSPRVRDDAGYDRGRELVEVLELAAAFPARHRRRMSYPKFGTSPTDL
ncbi:MAG: helix-turn-helix transcriptional regulator [Pseudomonadales bacterium]